MKEIDLVRLLLESRIRYYRTITYALLGIVAICVLTLAGTLFAPSKPDQEIVTLFITLTSSLFGSLVTIIVQGIQTARKLRSDEELEKTVEEIKTNGGTAV